MNNNNFSGLPAISVNGFCLAPPDLLLQIKSYFGLAADLPLLTAIQRHFASVQRREPTSDELSLLDAYFTAEPTDPARFLLSSLETDDPRIGETYDDLRAKAAELDRKLPLTLTELFGFGGACLSAVGRRAPKRTRAVSGRDALLRMSLCPGSSPAIIKGGGVIGALDLADASAGNETEPVDCLVYVSGPEENFISELSSLILSGRGRFTVGAAAVADDGLLNALLKITPGALLDLTVLPGIELLSLAECSDSAALLKVSGANAPALIAEAGCFGLTARICGRTDDLKRLTIVTGRGLPVNLSTEFLKNTLPRFALHAEVMRREPAAAEDCGFDLTTIDASGHSKNVVFAGGRVATADGIDALSYDDACLALIEGISRLVAAGASYGDICASLELRLGHPSDRSQAGDSVGALLGLYRVQTELCLRTSGCRIDFDDIGLGAILSAKVDSPLPDTLQSPGSRVYLLAPRSDEFGLPRFADLRRLYDYVGGLIKNGELLSAHAVGRAGLDAAIKAVSAENPLYLVGEKPTEFALGGFIVESENELDGIFFGICE